MQKKCRRQAKLTDASVRKLRCEPNTKQTVWWDAPAGPAYVRGLHVIVYQSGRACWYVRLKDRQAKSRYRVVRLGDVSEVSAERARDMASAEILAARLGRTLTTAEAAMTVKQAVDRLLVEYRTSGKARPIANNRKWKCYLHLLTAEHGHRPLEAITTADLQKIVDNYSKASAGLCRSRYIQMWKWAISQRWIPMMANPAESGENSAGGHEHRFRAAGWNVMERGCVASPVSATRTEVPTRAGRRTSR